MATGHAFSSTPTATRSSAKVRKNGHGVECGMCTTAWGRAVLAASQAVVLLGIVDRATNSHMVAPLLLGAASVLVHQGVLTGNRWYQAVAIAEVVLALHADFFVPSWLDRRDVLWVLLLIWAALLLARRALSISAPAMGGGAGLLALAVMAHVAYHLSLIHI